MEHLLFQHYENPYIPLEASIDLINHVQQWFDPVTPNRQFVKTLYDSNSIVTLEMSPSLTVSKLMPHNVPGTIPPSTLSELIALKKLAKSECAHLAVHCITAEITIDSTRINRPYSPFTLKDIITCNLPRVTCIRLRQEIGSAIVEMHSVALVHSDIKTSYILVQSDGSFVLSDFDSTVHVDEDCKEALCNDVHIGTPCYRAPELFMALFDSENALPYNAYKIDMWSLGMVVLECIKSSKPFIKANDSPEHMFAQCETIAREQNGELVSGLLCLDPSQRYL